jgi:hypothetical protein
MTDITKQRKEFLSAWIKRGAQMYAEARRIGIPHRDCMHVDHLQFLINLTKNETENNKQG